MPEIRGYSPPVQETVRRNTLSATNRQSAGAGAEAQPSKKTRDVEVILTSEAARGEKATYEKLNMRRASGEAAELSRSKSGQRNPPEGARSAQSSELTNRATVPQSNATRSR